MNMKRTLAMVLAVMMAVSVVGCSSSTSSSGDSSAGSTADSASAGSSSTQTDSTDGSYVNPPGEYPIVNEKISLEVVVGNDGTIIEDLETNGFTAWYEELTNIHIDWNVIVGDTKEKVPLIMASGDLPDIIMGTSMTAAELLSYADQGLIIPLEPYFDDYAPNIKKVFEEVQMARDSSLTPDGHVYALNRLVDSFNESMPKRAWIYQPWLDTLGLDMPTTTEEFRTVLEAFRDQDPNGNGLKDEVPFAGSDSSANGEIDSFILNSFLYYDRATYGLELLEDGTVRCNIGSEEYREGLRYLHGLLVDGLLAPETFTQDRNALKALTEGGEVNQLGAVTAFYWGHFTNENDEKGRDKEFVAIPVLKGPEGVQYAYDRGTLMNGQRFEITNACEYPEAAMRWADYFYDADGMMEMGYSANAGKEGVDWKKADEGVLGIDGEQAKYEYIVAPGQKQNSYWFQLPPYYESADYINSWAANLPSSRKEVFGNAESEAKYLPYSALDKRVAIYFPAPEYATEWTDLQLNMKTTVEKYRAGFIMGDYDLDADWDQYLADLEVSGMERYAELAQILLEQTAAE